MISFLPWSLVSFQVNKIKQSVFFSSVSTSFLLLAELQHQHYFVTGSSMCASLPFDMEHQERFHRTARHTSVWTAFKGRPLSYACCFAYMTVTLPDIHAMYTHMSYMHMHTGHVWLQSEPEKWEDTSMVSVRISNIHADVLHHENENELPEAVSYDWDVLHKLALCMCRTPNYCSQWRLSASFKKGSRAQILCLGPNSSQSCG